MEEKREFTGLGVNDLGIFEFGGEINQTEINLTKIYRRETVNSQAIKGKINYNGKRFKEGEPAGYKGEWKWGKKSGLFTFIVGNLEETKISSPSNLAELTMLEITREKLRKLNSRFRNYLEERPFNF